MGVVAAAATDVRYCAPLPVISFPSYLLSTSITSCQVAHRVFLPEHPLPSFHISQPRASPTAAMASRSRTFPNIKTNHRADRPGQQNSGRDQSLPYHLNADIIRSDLTTGGADGEKPTWPLSCYGPGRDAPRQLLEGIIEQSPEECRVLYYQAQAAGQLQEYVRGPFPAGFSMTR